MNPTLLPDSPRARPTPIREYLGVSLFWLALSFLWGALLTIALPNHIEALFGQEHKDVALATLTASGAAVAAVSQIVFGALSDGSRSKWGRRRPFLFWGTLLAVGPLLLLPHAHTLAMLVLVYAALQLTINIAGGPYGALMHDRIPAPDHGTAGAWIGVVGLLGRIGGPIVAVVILGGGAGRFGLLLETFALVLVVVMGATLWLVREKPLGAPVGTSQRDQIVEAGAPPIASPLGGDFFAALPQMSLGKRLSDTFRVPLRPYPDFRWLIASRFGIMMGVYTVSNFLLYYISDTLGFGKEGSGPIVRNFLVLSTLTGLVGTFPSGMLSRRIGLKPVLYGANAISMLAGLGFALAPNLTVAYIAAGVFGAGFGAFSAVDWALATGLLPPREPAKYMGVWGLSDTVSQVIAPLVAGPLAYGINHAFGHGVGYRALMLLALGWFFVGTLALRPIRERHSPTDEHG